MSKTTCSTLLTPITILLCLLLAAPTLAAECEIIDSEFTVLNNSLNTPNSAVLDASGSPAQSDPSSQSYLIDIEYGIADVTTIGPWSAVLDASTSPVQSEPSSWCYLIDTEYGVADVTTVSPDSDVLDASGAPVQSNPSSQIYLIDIEYGIADVTTIGPWSAVLDASTSPVQSEPSSWCYLIDTEYGVADVTTVSPDSDVLDASGAPVQSNPSSQSYLIDTEYNVADTTTSSPASAITDASGSPVQSDPSSQSYLIDTEFTVVDESEPEPWSGADYFYYYPTSAFPGEETELTVIVKLTEISMRAGDPVQWYITTPGGETITGESDALKCCLVGGLYDRAYYDFPESGTYTIRVEFPGYTEYAEWPVEVAAPPTITITTPASGTIVSTSTVTITGTASSDTSSVASVTVNGVPATGTTNWNADVNLVEGENIITIIAKDLEHNKRTVKLQLFYYGHEDIHPLFSNVPHVEVGGTFYRWYMTTFRDSTIAIDSNYLDYTQPDENGVFNVSVNTSKRGITSPGTVDVLTYSDSITKNGQTMQADTSLFNFTLNILPRNYSTSWYLGNTIGGGGGIIPYVEGEENTDFRMTTGNHDSILLMNRDINNKGTIGATAALFEAEAPGVNFEAVKGDIHGSVQEIYGSQVNVDYENAEDVQKLESSLYILTSTIPHGTNPMMAKIIDTVLDELTADLTTDYYESGVGISGGGGVDILKVGFGLESTEEPERARIGCADIGFGLGFEAGASLKNRTYQTIDSQEYLIQYVYSAKKGIDGSVLDNDIVDWGKVNI